MNILAIESSCDETAAAIIQDGRTIRANVIFSQADLHALYGGVVPEIASRKHAECIVAVTQQAMRESGLTKEGIDAVAVTCAPGLIGALLVGVNFAKSLAFSWHKPLIPVHHLRGHLAANYLAFPQLEPPFLCLIVSGGNSLLVQVQDYTDFSILGGTRDDAAGEAFDKVARVLGLGYPGGVQVDRLAQMGNPETYTLPRAKIEQAPLDFSFSGLKTAVINLCHRAEQKGEEIGRADLAASFSQAVSDTLVLRTKLALEQTGSPILVAAGGVAANSFLRRDLQRLCQEKSVELYLPPLDLCGDNAAMIGSQAYYEWLDGVRGGLKQNAYATREITDCICDL